MLDLDAPYHLLGALPNALWLPAVITSAGRSAQRLADLNHWRVALAAGELPAETLDFGDPQALHPMRHAVAALALPDLCRGAPALAQQVLRTLLAPGPHQPPPAPAEPRRRHCAGGAGLSR